MISNRIVSLVVCAACSMLANAKVGDILAIREGRRGVVLDFVASSAE